MNQIKRAKDTNQPGSLLLVSAYGYLVLDILEQSRSTPPNATLFPRAYLEGHQFPITSVGLVPILPCWT